MTEEDKTSAPPPGSGQTGSQEPEPATLGDIVAALAEAPRVAVNEVVKPELVHFYHQPAPTFLVTPPNFQVHQTRDAILNWEQRQPKPPRRKGVFKASNIDSLIAWMNANCESDAPVFAVGAEKLANEWSDPKLALLGIGNYSHKTDGEWHDWGCRYDFPVTAAWRKWCDKSEEWLSQAEFSEFIEAHLYEISSPQSGEELSEQTTQMIEALGGTSQVASVSAMYAVANGIKITVKESVEVEINRSSGAGMLQFTEEHTGKGTRPLDIPKFFYIRIPVFFGEPETLIGVFLRYRNAGGGKVLWSYEIHAPELVVQSCMEQACDVVRDEGRTLYWGSPDDPSRP